MLCLYFLFLVYFLNVGEVFQGFILPLDFLFSYDLVRFLVDFCYFSTVFLLSFFSIYEGVVLLYLGVSSVYFDQDFLFFLRASVYLRFSGLRSLLFLFLSLVLTPIFFFTLACFCH